MITRLLALTVLVCVLVAMFSRFGQATDQLTADSMKAALRTATPEDNGFIDRVLEKMNTGKISRSLVVTTFEWARKKNTHRFQYFKRAIIKRAAEIGVTF